MNLTEAFERALPGSKYPSVHIIELACMIQVFWLICFWAKTKWTYVQKEKRNLYSTGGDTPAPRFVEYLLSEKESQPVRLRLELLFSCRFLQLIIDYSLLTRLPASVWRFTWSPRPPSGGPPGGRSWLERGCWSAPAQWRWGSPTGYWSSWTRPTERICAGRRCSTGWVQRRGWGRGETDPFGFERNRWPASQRRAWPVTALVQRSGWFPPRWRTQPV